MGVKDFLVRIPFLCDAENAARWSRMIELVYDDELKTKDSVFARNSLDEEDPYNRFELAFAFSSGEVDKIDYCMDLVDLIFLSHYKAERKETKYDEQIKELVSVLEEVEPSYPEIAEAMTVKQAASGTWND